MSLSMHAALPTPTRVPAGSRTAGEVQRLVFCASYQDCLDLAVRRGWEDWTCSRCLLAPLAATPSAASFATRQPRDRD